LSSGRCLDHVFETLVVQTLPVHLLGLAGLTLRELAASFSVAVLLFHGVVHLPIQMAVLVSVRHHLLLIVHHLRVFCQLGVVPRLRHLLVHAHAFLVLDVALLASNIATLTYQTCAVLLLLLL
jgi:hypothetical protein